MQISWQSIQMLLQQESERERERESGWKTVMGDEKREMNMSILGKGVQARTWEWEKILKWRDPFRSYLGQSIFGQLHLGKCIPSVGHIVMWPSSWCQLDHKHRSKRSYYYSYSHEWQGLAADPTVWMTIADKGKEWEFHSKTTHTKYVSWSEAQAEPTAWKYNSSTCTVAREPGNKTFSVSFFSFSPSPPS